MTEKTAWADLPNAKYIDLVLASMNKNPAAWDAAWGAAWNAAWGAAKDAARAMVREAVWDEVRDAAWGAASDAAWGAAWDATLALIAWDDCDYLLEEKPENVKMLALLGNHAAVLLYPACVALQNIKELENSVAFA
jgi:hypothetical protein